MELCKELLASVLSREEVCVTFPDLELDAGKIVESETYRALQKIRAILEDESLSDFECIEGIVCVFEGLNIAIKARHDF